MHGPPGNDEEKPAKCNQYVSIDKAMQ